MLKRINQTLDVVADGSALIGRILMVVIMAMIVFGVVSRYVFNNPFSFVNEYTMYMMVAVSIFAANWVLREDGHVKVDIMFDVIPKKVMRWVTVVTDAVSIGVITVFLLQTAKLAAMSLDAGTISITEMRTPIGPVQLIIPIALGLLLLEFLRVFVKSIIKAVNPK